MPFRLFDTHVHLNNERFLEDLDEVLARARAAGVARLLQASYDIESSRSSCAMSRRLTALDGPAPAMWCAVGVHPHDAASLDSAAVDVLRALLDDRVANRIVAIGEIGLDYHYDLSPRSRQREAFIAQLELARTYGLPVIIHEREAHEDCLAVLRAFGPADALHREPGVFHCFSGSPEMAQELVSMGFLLGFDGPLTFHNARRAPDVVRAVPADRLLIETDCPYLTPEPRRGQRNEPAYVVEVARKLAELLSLDLEEAADLTWNNACRLFGIDL